MQKFPIATIFLVLAITSSYLLLSQGTLYISDDSFTPFAAVYQSSGLTGGVSHIFLHIGPDHLLGNLVALVAFGILLEVAIGALDVFMIFFVSGLFAGALFSFLNPAIPLAGASAAISGLMGGALALRPRHSLALLFVVPVLLYAVINPASNFASQDYSQKVSFQQENLSKKVQELYQQNKTAEALQTQKQLQAVQEKKETIAQAKKRESTSESAFLAHVFGAVVGVTYLYAFRRKKMREGLEEFEILGKQVHDTISSGKFFLGKFFQGFGGKNSLRLHGNKKSKPKNA